MDYELITVWSCPGVLHVVPANRSKYNAGLFIPPGASLFVVVIFFYGANIFDPLVFRHLC